jgi:hypothetical protein
MSLELSFLQPVPANKRAIKYNIINGPDAGSNLEAVMRYRENLTVGIY